MLRITRTFKTTPTIALNTLAGIPPLHLTLKYDGLRAHVFQLGRTPPNLTFLTNKQILIKTTSFHLKPSAINFPFSTAKPHSNNQYKIFTDGSKSDDGVGAAFAVFHNSSLIFQKSYKLNSESTVFQAEIQAIKEALTWLKLNSAPLCIKNIQLLSDSQASLKAISKFKQQEPPLQKIQSQLLDLTKTLNLKLFWVKGHAGCSGNELADSLAKSATLKLNTDIQLPLSPSYVKNQLKALLSRDWQALWSNSDRGRTTHSLLPKVSTAILFDSPNINTLLTNHGPFPQYLHKFKIFQSPLCICGCEGSSHHYIFHCPLTKEYHFKKPLGQFWEEWCKKTQQ